MKPTQRFLAFLFIFITALSPGCMVFENGDAPAKVTDPVALIAVITVPGNPIGSGTKSWVDATQVSHGTYLGSMRYYLTDVSNAGVDIIDAENNTYLGRVTGFAGNATAGGGTPTTNGNGPSSITFTPNNTSFVSDGNSMVRVVDNNTMQILASIDVSIPACDGGTATTRYCGRTNEMTYDPEHKLVFVQSPAPLAVGGTHAALDPYATFISAVPPYTIQGTVTFEGAGNQEAPLWNPESRRLLSAVTGRIVGGVVVSPQYVAVINPVTRAIEDKWVIDCGVLTGTVQLGINDPALGPDGHMIIPGCGRPVIMDARTGKVLTVITQVGGGNETWYNPGDKRFYVTGADAVTGVTSLGVIDAVTNTWLQNVPAPGATNPTAFEKNNHIFAVVQVNAAQIADPTTDNTACAQFNVKGKGCIAVFAHVAP